MTDSASQIPAPLATALGVHVVPVVVTVDGVEYREGVDLDADQFWDRVDQLELAELSTSQPSPGAIAASYAEVVASGASEIVSVHVGATVSGTVNAARLAAGDAGVAVHVVDSGTASFGVTACLWQAVLAARAGADAAAAAEVARAMAPRIGTSFILQGLEFARAGGRFDFTLPGEADDIVVLAGHGTALEVVGAGRDLDSLCDQIVAPFLAGGIPIRAGIGLADGTTGPIVQGIEDRLRASALVVDLVRYRVGPSIAAHTGPGTAGGFWWPAEY